jgi:hypothetical protein
MTKWTAAADLPATPAPPAVCLPGGLDSSALDLRGFRPANGAAMRASPILLLVRAALASLRGRNKNAFSLNASSCGHR